MGTISTLIFFLCGYSGYIGAIILTTYEKSSPVSVSGLVSCGKNAISFDFCAARVTNNTCDPLDRDWCETKDMSSGGVYIIKKAITELLQDTLVIRYDRQIPIYLSEGSELEFKFILHPGWSDYYFNLQDDSGNIVLHTKIRHPDDFYFNANVDGEWVSSSEGYFGTVSYINDVNYTMKIVCATNGFQIDLDGAYPWTYPYHLPPGTIRYIKSRYDGTQGGVYQVLYKARP